MGDHSRPKRLGKPAVPVDDVRQMSMVLEDRVKRLEVLLEALQARVEVLDGQAS